MKRALLLLLLAGCFHPAKLPPDPSGLPPIPRSVETSLGSIPVIWVDSLSDEQGRPLAGGYHSMQRAIYLRRELTLRVVQWRVLFHEKCHVWVSDSGLDNLIPPQLVQSICDASATAQVAEMLAAAKGRP